MDCPDCKRWVNGINHNGRGLRCEYCWAELPKPAPITPELLERMTPDLTVYGLTAQQVLTLHAMDIITHEQLAAMPVDQLMQAGLTKRAAQAIIKKAAG